MSTSLITRPIYRNYCESCHEYKQYWFLGLLCGDCRFENGECGGDY